MDMRRYLKPFLTVPVLQEMGGEYEGIIADVANEHLRNRFKATSEEHPVVAFSDGKRLVLNKTLLQMCLAWFGDDSDTWIGRRLRVFLRRGKRGLEKALACEDSHARISRPTATTHSHPQLSAKPPTTVDAELTALGAVCADDIPWDAEREETIDFAGLTKRS